MWRGLCLFICITCFYACSSLHNSSITFKVEKDSATIIAYQNGAVKWQTNVLKFCDSAKVGRNKIRHSILISGEIQVTYGKHNYASVNVETGEVKCLGAD